jgi:hypothetical protein
LEKIQEDPTNSTRKVAREVGVSHHKVHKVLKENDLYPFHLTKVQDLKPQDFDARLHFCDTILRRHCENPNFLRAVLWTDESLFTRDGVFNTHNSHYYDVSNPHLHEINKSQDRFQLMVWAGVIGNQLIGPYFFEGGINGKENNKKNYFFILI